MTQDEHVKLNPGFPWQRLHWRRRRNFFASKIGVKKKKIKCFIWIIAVYGAETQTL